VLLPEVDALLAALEGERDLDPRDLPRLRRAAASYARWHAEEFARSHDHFHLVGQDNLRRYLPVDKLRIRIHPDDDSFDVVARLMAARQVGCQTTLSADPRGEDPRGAALAELTRGWAEAPRWVEESDAELAGAVLSGETERIRFAAGSRVPAQLREAAARTGLYLAGAPVLAAGRIELLHYLREQSLSIDTHRYGNLAAAGLQGVSAPEKSST